MAVVADIDNLDLVVEPHEWTPEDREAIRQAVEEIRKRQTDARLAEYMKQWLTQRREAADQTCRRAQR